MSILNCMKIGGIFEIRARPRSRCEFRNIQGCNAAEGFSSAVKIAKLLLDRGANVDVERNDGWTASIFAVSNCEDYR